MYSERTQVEMLNSLPDSHWRDWYASERKHGALLDEGIAQGMTVEQAADYAADGVLS